MKALVQDRIGSPLDVVELRDVPRPQAGPGQTLVRMVAAGIHPGDFFFTQGLYPEAKRPQLPGQIVGNHGVGRVVSGGHRADLAPGTLVQGKLANRMALENEIRPVFIGNGFGNYADRFDRDDVRYILT